MKRLFAALLATTAFALPSGANASECGQVSIADMNWSSAELIAYVDKFILETAFDCEAELVPGDTIPTGTSMIEKGEPDIAPELWANNFVEALQKGIEEKRLRFSTDSLSDGGEEGFWVPKFMIEKHPELATIEGIKANPQLFPHPEDPDKGAFYGCPAGWGCQLSSGNLFRALKLEDAGFEIIDPGSAAGLDGSIINANERGEGWFGYYWAPTAILGSYEMVRIPLSSEVKLDHFQDCIAKAECENPQVTDYPASPVKTLTTEAFAQRVPAAYDYLTKRSFTNAQMNKLLAWKKEEQADGEIAAEYFIKNHEAIWTKWLTADQVAKVKKAVDAL